MSSLRNYFTMVTSEEWEVLNFISFFPFGFCTCYFCIFKFKMKNYHPNQSIISFRYPLFSLLDDTSNRKQSCDISVSSKVFLLPKWIIT